MCIDRVAAVRHGRGGDGAVRRLGSDDGVRHRLVGAHTVEEHGQAAASDDGDQFERVGARRTARRCSRRRSLRLVAVVVPLMGDGERRRTGPEAKRQESRPQGGGVENTHGMIEPSRKGGWRLSFTDSRSGRALERGPQAKVRGGLGSVSGTTLSNVTLRTPANVRSGFQATTTVKQSQRANDAGQQRPQGPATDSSALRSAWPTMSST